MKYINSILKFGLLVSTSILLSCSEPSGSSSGSGEGSGGSTPVVDSSSSDSGKSCDNYQPISSAYDSANRHIYLGEFRLDRNSNAQKAYRSFIEDFGLFCKNNSGFKWQYNNYRQQWEYAAHYSWGVANCSDWDDFFKLWIIFPRNNPRSAHLVVDSTMSGYPTGGGQGYDLQRINLPNSQIDCGTTNKTVIYFEPVYGLQFKVDIYKGSKNTENQRAEVFYKGASLGKTDFFIIQK